MSRPIAVLLAVVLVGLMVLTAATGQNGVSGSIDRQMHLVNLIAQALLAWGLFLYCGFAALHSIQHLDSPQDRSLWLISTVVLNVLGSCLYYVTVYQTLRKAGQGRLMRFKWKGRGA